MKLTGYSFAARSSAVFQLVSFNTPDTKNISASASRIKTSILGHTNPRSMRTLKSVLALLYRTSLVSGIGAVPAFMGDGTMQCSFQVLLRPAIVERPGAGAIATTDLAMHDCRSCRGRGPRWARRDGQ